MKLLQIPLTRGTLLVRMVLQCRLAVRLADIVLRRHPALVLQTEKRIQVFPAGRLCLCLLLPIRKLGGKVGVVPVVPVVPVVIAQGGKVDRGLSLLLCLVPSCHAGIPISI